MPKARAAALRALEIDESLPEAHTALALIVQNYDWNWQTAEKEYGRAIELNPNYATAHHWYAEHLVHRVSITELCALVGTCMASFAKSDQSLVRSCINFP
jgi:Tfp pilus assembly protein PilF